jgi:hypothetical protein
LREFDSPGWGVPYVIGLSLFSEGLALAPDPHHFYAVVMTLCYAPLPAGGLLVAAVTVQYYQRRSADVTRQVIASKDDTTSTTVAAS